MTIKRKYSSLPSISPTVDMIQNKMDFLGTTIIKLDIPGTDVDSNKSIKDSTIYLEDSDIIYFCINVLNPRISETKAYINRIKQVLEKTNLIIPIIFIITKVDEDVAEDPKIKKSIVQIKKEISPLVSDYPFRFFSTSIFSLYSILNAFSFGIRQLSPNREMLKIVLSNFLLQNNLKTGLLLNENGIVLASAETETEYLPSIGNTLNTSQIFEVAAPQFASIASQFQETDKDQLFPLIKYEFSPHDLILLQKFMIYDFGIFALFYSQEGKNLEVINSISEQFLDLFAKIGNLLHYYIN